MLSQWYNDGSVNSQMIWNHNRKICGAFCFSSIPVAWRNSCEFCSVICSASQNRSSVPAHSVQDIFHSVMAKNCNDIMVYG